MEVQVSEVAYREDGVSRSTPMIWAETESQKGILIGAGGSKIKEIGTAARTELERELGGRVFLDLQVRVRKRWRTRREPARPPRDRVGSSHPVHRWTLGSGGTSAFDHERRRLTWSATGEEWTEEDERHPGGAEKPMPVQEEGLALGLEGLDESDPDIDPEIAAEVELAGGDTGETEEEHGPVQDAVEDLGEED